MRMTKIDAQRRHEPRPFSARARGVRASTTRASSTTPAASRSSSTSRAAPAASIVTDALDALCNLDHRGASGAEVNTGDGAGILLQVPDRFLRAVVDFDAAAGRAPTASASPSSRSTPRRRREDRWPASTPSSRTRASGSSAGATCPIDTSMIGPTALQRDAELPPAVRRRPRRAPTGIELDRKLFVVRKRCEHELATRRRATSGLLPVAVEPHARLQGHAHHAPARASSSPTSPTSGSSPRSRWCTAASPPTRSRRGRSRTRTGYIAHNGEINTVQGNRNWMRAREALMATPLIPRPRARVPDRHARRVRHRELRRVPRAAAPRGPADLARGADDDPGGVGEPRDDGRRASARSTATTRR